MHQTSPYNKYCYTKSGEQAVVGCVALACGMVMRSCQYPPNHDGITFDWQNMLANPNDDSLARLLEMLGRSENLNNNYGTSSTGSYRYYIPHTFMNFGYEVNGTIEDFSLENVTNALKHHIPVLVGGNNTSTAEGHVWVIDSGYYTYTVPLDFEPGTPPDIFYGPTYLHCVWGWGGKGNGYFYYNNHLGGEAKNYDGESIPTQTYKNIQVFYKYSIPSH